MRRQCNWCGKKADAISDDGARALGWLVGATAMCPDCAGPLVCGLCGAEECGCERHVIPANDLIGHHSLDGREQHETRP